MKMQHNIGKYLLDKRCLSPSLMFPFGFIWLIAVLLCPSCSFDHSPTKYKGFPAIQTSGTEDQWYQGGSFGSDPLSSGTSLNAVTDEPTQRFPNTPQDAGIIVGEVGKDSSDLSNTPATNADEKIGLRCRNIICPSVTVPSEQCCTEELDTIEHRAVTVDRCGIRQQGAVGCTELEQMGVLDDSCPSMKPPISTVEEPGCCNTLGRCGTFRVEESIGCQENPGVEKTCGERSVDTSKDCEPTGIYGVLAEVDVAWGGQSGLLFELVDHGRGIDRMVLKITIESVDADNMFVGKVKTCDAEMPPIVSSLMCESYTPTFPTSIWDSENMPDIEVEGAFSCLSPGCILTFYPTSASIGIELADEGVAWPTAEQAMLLQCSSGVGEDCYPDHDGDGYPGITVVLPNGTEPGTGVCAAIGYQKQAAPLNANLGAIFDGVYRTDRLHLGVRVRLGMSGQLADDCTIADAVGVAEFIQSRAAGCRLEPGSQDLFAVPAGPNDLCTPEQLLFMDQNLPIYDILGLGEVPSSQLNLIDRSPSEGPRFQLIRLGDVDQDISCQDVRDSF